MRRLHVVLSDEAAEHLDELQMFWWEGTGDTPSPDKVIQQALADYHRSNLGGARAPRRPLRRPMHLAMAPVPQGISKGRRAG